MLKLTKFQLNFQPKLVAFGRPIKIDSFDDFPKFLLHQTPSFTRYSFDKPHILVGLEPVEVRHSYGGCRCIHALDYLITHVLMD